MDDVIIEIDSLVVDLDAANVAAVAAGQVDALGPAVVAALRSHPAVRSRVSVDGTIGTSLPDPGRQTDNR